MRLSGTLALCWLALSPLAAAQTVVNHPFNTGVVATYTFESGPNTAFFDYFDSGGSGGNYSLNSVAASSVVTFVAPPGRRIRVTFSAFQTEATWADRLYVYNGADTTAPIIPSANGAPGIVDCAAQGWDATTAPNNAGPNVLDSSGQRPGVQLSAATPRSPKRVGPPVSSWCRRRRRRRRCRSRR